MNILKNIFKFNNNKTENEAVISSYPFNFIESFLPNAECASIISERNLEDFNEDSYYKNIFIRAKHAILTKLEYSSYKKAVIVFTKHNIVDSKVERYIKSPLIELGYSVKITKKPNKDDNCIPFDYWLEITW